MSVAQMLGTVGSMEIGEWICELTLRDKEQAEAMRKAESGQPVLGG